MLTSRLGGYPTTLPEVSVATLLSAAAFFPLRLLAL
mgnify:CR=1 FL=1